MAKQKKAEQRDLVDKATDAVRKKFKDSTMGRGSGLVSPTVWASTGALSLDRVCRGALPGGVPLGPNFGRIVHIAGEWSTGKSLILDHLFKSVQELGGVAVCSETEASRDPHFANLIGLDLSALVLNRPPTIEKAFDEFMIWHGVFRAASPEVPILWGIDSLDSTEAERTSDTKLSDTGLFQYGAGRSKALGECLRRFANKVCNHYPTTLVMLNQTRENIGMFAGPKKRTPGGNPPHFYASLEVMLSVGQKGDVRGKYEGAKLTAEQRKRLGMRATERGDVIGRWIRAKITKNKLTGTQQQEADFYIGFYKGVHKWAGLLQRFLHEGKVELIGKERVKQGEHEFANEKEWIMWLAKQPKELFR